MFLITEHFGDFDRSINIGKLLGGFGTAAATSAAVSSPASSETTSTVIGTPQSNLSVSHRRKEKRLQSFSPTTPSVEQTQSLADEFISLSASRTNLMTMLNEEDDLDEKALVQIMIDRVVKRRKEVAALSAI
jgi:hypothetical protein